jgi:predicted PurR-regulated permease PerM
MLILSFTNPAGLISCPVSHVIRSTNIIKSKSGPFNFWKKYSKLYTFHTDLNRTYFNTMNQENFSKTTLLIITLGISILFIAMIKGFLMAIFMAAIFTGLLNPIYKKIKGWFRGRQSPAALATILFLVFLILIPFSALLFVVVEQAIDASKSAGPILNEIIDDPESIITDIESIPIVQKIFPEREKLAATIDNIVQSLGNFVITGLSDFSAGTANFIFSLFIFLFTLYYFLIHGKEYLSKLLYYLPLKHEDEKLLLSRFVMVTRATLKGTFLIGIIQGTLGAVGMAILGIPNVLFWGMLMVVFSVIPALGPAIIWIPAAVFLFLQGNVLNGIILIIWGAVVIGNIDNFLRPKLVGKDAQMPDLMILFGTLGGLAFFGVAGIIVGPIIGALFLTLWDIYGTAFKDILYPVKGRFKRDMTDPEKEETAPGKT